MKPASRDKRRDEILDTAIKVLSEKGYRDTSMLEVARRASASKETLYAWFGDKRGLFEAVIERNAQTVQMVLTRSLATDAPPGPVLEDFGRALLQLLLGDSAVAINRAAIAEARSDPTLAQTLARAGREATLPAFIGFLEQHRQRGTLAIDSAPQAAEDFLGLLLGDAQIRRLLDLMPIPSDDQIVLRAEHAVHMFLRVYGA